MYKARNDWDIIQEARQKKLPKKHISRYKIRMPLENKPIVVQLYDEPTGYAGIFVANVDPEATKDQIFELFQQFGEVSDVFVPIDFITHKSKGFAFVEFEEKSSAEKAISSSQKIQLNGRQLYTNWAKPRNKII